jgi:hypothetical protein
MTFEEIRASPVGLWFDCSKGANKIIVKISTYLIKHIYNGVKIDLIAAVYKNLNDTYPMLGLRIFDDPDYPSLITERVETKQLSHFKNVVQSENTEVELYDELGFPSLFGGVHIDRNIQDKLANYYGASHQFTDDRDFSKASESLDFFAISLENEKATGRILKLDYFKIRFYELAQVENFHIRSHEISKISPLDFLEGDQLEHQIAIASESIFNQNTFKSPYVQKGDKLRELIDVLMKYDRGLFLIETKAMSVFNKNDQKFERKSKSIIKQAKKGIDQLVGANKQLKKGSYLFDVNGNKINYDSEMITQNIVLVSELVQFDEQEDIKKYLLKSIITNNLSIQLIGFDEYMLIIKAAEGKMELFDYYLLERMNGWVTQRCPINFKLKFVKE